MGLSLRGTDGAGGARAATLWLAVLAAAMVGQMAAGFCDNARLCARCDGAIEDKLKVVVTDFAAGQEHVYCNLACAIEAMAENFPTARAVAHDPFAGKEVRVIRTGAKWVAWPKSAEFLLLAESRREASSRETNVAQANKPAAEDQPTPRRRRLAFPRRIEYVQYLATHPEAAALRPHPRSLPELLEALKATAAAGQPPKD